MKKHLLFFAALMLMIFINTNAQQNVPAADRHGASTSVTKQATPANSMFSANTANTAVQGRQAVQGKIVASLSNATDAAPSYTSHGTRSTIASYDFESGMPGNFTLTHASGQNWQVGSSGGSSSFPIPAHTNYAYYNDDALPNSTISHDVRMILPAFNFTANANPAIAFDQRYINTYGDILKIQVSTNGGTTWTDIYTPPTGNVAWTRSEVSLLNYAGMSSVTICFYYDDNGSWAYGWAVDNIEILDIEANDLAFESITPHVVVSGSTVSPVVTVKNTGTNSASGWTVTLSDGGAYTSTVPGTTLAPSQTQQVTMASWTPADGIYTLTATINYAADNYLPNNTGSAQVTVAQECTNTILMHDSYGDGWNGGAINVIQGGEIVQTVTLSYGFEGQATVSVIATTTNYSWVAGSFGSEVSFEIYDNNNILLHSQSPAPSAGVFFSYNNTCSAMLPIDLTAVSITPTTGITNTQTIPVVNVLNHGTTSATSWTVTVTSGSYTSTKPGPALASANTCNVSMDPYTATVQGPITWNVTVNIAGDANPADNTITAVCNFYDANTFAGNTTTNQYNAVNIETGVSLVNLGTIPSTINFPMAEEYGAGHFYRVYDNGLFGRSDEGTFVTIATLSLGGKTPTGLAYNHTTNTMYLSAIDNNNYLSLYTVNLTSGAVTLVGGGTTSCMLIAMDFANDGFLYGPDIVSDNLVKIDPVTVAVTVIGSIGFNANYGQDVTYDMATNRLYTYTCGAIYAYGYYDIFTGLFIQLASNGSNQVATLATSRTAIPCAPVTNLNNTVNGTNVTLTWTAAAGSTGYEIKRDGTVITTVTATTYVDNGVQFGSHTYMVTPVGQTGCDIAVPMITTASVGTNCNYTILMHDSWGDGWNGAGIQVTQGSSSNVYTFTSGSEGTASVTLYAGVPATFTWQAGSYDSECTFDILNPFGDIIYSQTTQPTAGVFFNHTPNCTPPPSVTVSGTVVNTSGTPVANATVAFLDAPGYTTTTTNASGTYSVSLYQSYTYNLTVSATGYNTQTEVYEAPASATATLNIQLLNPALAVSASDINICTHYGTDGTQAFEITNDGSGELTWSLKKTYLDKIFRDPWDLMAQYNLSGAGEQGVATDGEYIYTAFWGTNGKIGKYEMDGTLVGTFIIPGLGGVRDITYDGTYFYCSAASTTIYKCNFTTQTLVGTISSAVSARHISFDYTTGNFWVGPWDGLAEISPSGALIHSYNTGLDGMYGSAIDYITAGGPYILLFDQNGNGSDVHRFNMSSLTMDPSFIFDVNAALGTPDGIAGGLFIGEFEGIPSVFANVQDEPTNVIGIFELGSAGWLAVNPSSGVLAPGSSQTVALTADGTWDASGFWHAILEIQSKNPNIGSEEININYEIRPAGAQPCGILVPEINDNEVCVFPNPTKDVVNIIGDNIVKLEVFNSFGQLIEKNTGFKNSLNVSSYSNGVYFIKLYDANQSSVTKRVVISK